MRKHFRKYAAVAALTCVFSPSASAGGVLFDTHDIHNGRDTVSTSLEDLEVTAVKRNDVTRSSVPLQRVDAERMRTSAMTDISDALRRMAGVTLRDYGGEGGMKTLSLRGLGSQHTGVVYDGISLSDVQSGQIDLSRYTLATVSEMAVSHGDGDDIFVPARTSASSAVLSISTLMAPSTLDEDLKLTMRMKAGSFGYYSPSLYLGKSFGEKVSLSATGDYTHSDNDFPFTVHNGLETAKEKRLNSGLNNGHGEINAIWVPSAGSSLKAKLYGYGKKQRLPGPVIYYSPDNNERLSETNLFGQAQYKVRFSDKWQLQANGRFNWAQTHYQDEKGIYPGGMLDSRYIQRETYVSAVAAYSPARGLRLSYAADYFYNSLSDNSAEASRPYRNSILQAMSLRWNVWRVSLTAKGLFSIFRQGAKNGDSGKNAQRLSPSVSASVQPLEDVDLHLRLSYKNIFRMPTFNELYFDHYGSVNLDPEITDQFNLGVTYASPRSEVFNVSGSVDGYLNHIRNKIVAMPYNMFVMTMTNLGKVRVTGIDMTLAADAAPAKGHKFVVNATYSYQRAATRTSRDMLDWNQQVAYTPLNSGAASIGWENPWVSIALHATGCSARYATNTNQPSSRIPGYIEAGAAIWHIFRFHSHSLEIRADLINALGKQYELVARYPMPGRSWQCSATFTL